MLQDLGDVEHRASGHAKPVELLGPISRRPSLQGRFDLSLQRRTVGLAGLTGLIVGRLDQIRPSDVAGQGLPLLVLVGGNVYETVRSVEGS